MDLAEKTALITGASRRVGRAIALALASEGTRVILHYRDSEDAANDTAERIRTMGGYASTTRMNLEETEAVDPWFASLMKEHGSIDILVNSASAYTKDRYFELNADRLSRSMALHLLAPLAMIRRMADLGSGSVVNILDVRAADRDPAHASYHLGKMALAAATRELAVELAPNMRINGVAPGLVLPPDGEGDDWMERLKGTNPLETRGYPEDVADAVIYLSKAGFVTGQIIYVDGGRHLKGLNHHD